LIEARLPAVWDVAQMGVAGEYGAWAACAATQPFSREVTIMAHHRIRTFNTSDTYPEQNLDNDLCQAVVTAGGRTVWMRGQCPQNLEDAKTIDSHDPAEQTHKVMQNIRQLVEEAGGGMAHLVKLVVYITDVRHREAVYRTMGEYIKGVHPVCTGLVVQALARPEWLVEIDATAVIPDGA